MDGHGGRRGGRSPSGRGRGRGGGGGSGGGGGGGGGRRHDGGESRRRSSGGRGRGRDAQHRVAHPAAAAAVHVARAGRAKVAPGPRRKWLCSELDQTIQDDDKFVLCSYNILSQQLLAASQYLYTARDPAALPWAVRGPRILDCLQRSTADIMMLQEVETDVFDSFFVPHLEAAGFTGTLEARKGKTDGCAVFWRKSRFEAEHVNRVDLSSDGPVLTWGNVGLVVVLREKAVTGRRVCVANTHLVFNEKRGEIKLAQAAILAHAVADAIAEVGGTTRTVPTVLGGDFNSTPQSKLIEFLLSGRLRFDGLDRRFISGQMEHGRTHASPSRGYILDHPFVPVAELPPRVGQAIHVMRAPSRGRAKGGESLEHHVAHPLRLRSPFDEHGVTSFQDKFAAVVDHIFYSDDQLTPIAIAELVGYRQLVGEGGMPSSLEPSDHQLIAVKLAFHKPPSL